MGGVARTSKEGNSMKSITIAGNVTKDGELRTTQNGDRVAGFSIAVNGYANGQKTVNYFDVSIWGKRGETAMQFAKRGAKMVVTGDLGTREHNGKTYLTVNASDFTPMGGGDSQQSNQGGGYGGQSSGGYGAGGSAMDEDTIPFSPEWRG
jgi:single-strand DNA-binding protein